MPMKGKGDHMESTRELEANHGSATGEHFRKPPVLYVVIPCYNEEDVLPITSTLFKNEVELLASKGKIVPGSRIMLVDDGSKDSTWNIIQQLASEDDTFVGVKLSRNKGHQNALLAGLSEASRFCDASISIDCDGQDDIAAMERMVDAYLDGCDVVYGVRSSRETDTFFKRVSAESFYRILEKMGVETVFNHADYRLLSARVLDELSRYHETNVFLRGMIPLVGFRSTSVLYERHERIAGRSHYPLSKMLALAADGVTSLSIKPVRIITCLGLVISALSFIGVIWAVVTALLGSGVAGWASTVCIVCFMGGIQLLCLGVIGEYVGKTYLETKHRPRYIVDYATYDESLRIDRRDHDGRTTRL